MTSTTISHYQQSVLAGHVNEVERLYRQLSQDQIPFFELNEILRAADARTSNVHMLRFFIQKNVDVTLSDANGNALHYAVGNEDMIRVLLEEGLDVEHRDDNGRTALHKAVALGKGYENNILVFLDYGMDPDIRDSEFNTPLFYTNNKETLLLLIKYGAKLNAKNNKGQTVVHVNVMKNNNENIIRILADKGADINIADNDGNTPVLTAVECGHIRMLQVLIEKNANINTKNNMGWNALDIAWFKNRPDIEKLLRDNGAKQF